MFLPWQNDAHSFEYVHRPSVEQQDWPRRTLQGRSESVPWKWERRVKRQRNLGAVNSDWTRADSTTCNWILPQVLEFQQQLLLWSQSLGHLAVPNSLLGDWLSFSTHILQGLSYMEFLQISFQDFAQLWLWTALQQLYPLQTAFWMVHISKPVGKEKN